MKITVYWEVRVKKATAQPLPNAFLTPRKPLELSQRLLSLTSFHTGCQACYACKTKLDRCILKDDLTPVLEAVKNSDVLVIATPTYYGDVSGQLKCFMDRTYSYLKPDYITNSQPSRLAPGKKLVFIITRATLMRGCSAMSFPFMISSSSGMVLRIAY